LKGEIETDLEALLIRNTLNYKVLSNLPDDDLEFIGIQVIKPKTKPFIVGTWYRPPGTNIEIFNKFDSLLGKIENYNMEVNIIGDLNCDLGASPLDHKATMLLNICSMYQYDQLIKHPTRITQNTSSTIDLFLTNNPAKFSYSGVCDIGLSDHCLIYAIRKTIIPKSNLKIVISRCFKKFDPFGFRNELSMIPWHKIKTERDPNKAWDLWYQMFLSIADKHAPLKKRRVKGSNCSWITPDLKKKKQMFERDRLKKIASKSSSQTNWANYTYTKNQVNYAIKAI